MGTKQHKKNDKVKIKDVLEVALWFAVIIIAIVGGVALCSGGGGDKEGTAAIPTKMVGFVYDPGKQLADTTVVKVNNRLRRLMSKTTAEVAVAVVPSTGDLSIEDWSQQTFQSLGLGKKDTDNGLLLVIATDQHQARLHTGYGLEGVLPDVTCSQILRNLVNPKMEQDKLDEAVDSATLLLDSILTNPTNAAEFVSKYTAVPAAVVAHDGEQRKIAEEKSDDVTLGYWVLGIILFLILLIVIIPRTYTPRRERYKKGALLTTGKTKPLECPNCHKPQYRLTSDMVTKAPSYKKAGKGMRSYSCDACGNSAQEHYAIARLKKWSIDGILSFMVFAAKMKSPGVDAGDDDDDYTSGGGYSGSSSGDFSGGSSGGGGASSEW